MDDDYSKLKKELNNVRFLLVKVYENPKYVIFSHVIFKTLMFLGTVIEKMQELEHILEREKS